MNRLSKVGRPPIFQKTEEMQPLIDAYFQECDEIAEPYTVPGLAYALGFADKQSLIYYSKKDEFCFTIKRAKFRIEAQRNKRLVEGKGNTAGMIFDLKNNFGWTDKQSIEHTSVEKSPVILWGGGSGKP